MVEDITFLGFCRGHIIKVPVNLVDGARGDCRFVGRDRGTSAMEYSCGISAAKRATTGLHGTFNRGLGIYELILQPCLCFVRA